MRQVKSDQTTTSTDSICFLLRNCFTVLTDWSPWMCWVSLAASLEAAQWETPLGFVRLLLRDNGSTWVIDKCLNLFGNHSLTRLLWLNTETSYNQYSLLRFKPLPLRTQLGVTVSPWEHGVSWEISINGFVDPFMCVEVTVWRFLTFLWRKVTQRGQCSCCFFYFWDQHVIWLDKLRRGNNPETLRYVSLFSLHLRLHALSSSHIPHLSDCLTPSKVPEGWG